MDVTDCVRENEVTDARLARGSEHVNEKV